MLFRSAYLLVVSPDQAEDEATVHQGQQIAEEEGQAGVEALGQLRILGAQGLSAHAHSPHGASVPAPRPWVSLTRPCLSFRLLAFLLGSD